MWDAFTGSLKASYRAYDAADEITAAISLCFSPNGYGLVVSALRALCTDIYMVMHTSEKIYAGYFQQLRVYDVSRPGREVNSRAPCLCCVAIWHADAFRLRTTSVTRSRHWKPCGRTNAKFAMDSEASSPRLT